MATSPAKKAIDANRGKVAPFVTNQVSLHDHQPQKIDGKTYNFSSSQIPNLDWHVAMMTIPSQVLVLASLFASSSNYYSFKMQASRYSCKNLTLEMDLTNTSAATVQLVPVPILVNYIKRTWRLYHWCSWGHHFECLSAKTGCQVLFERSLRCQVGRTEEQASPVEVPEYCSPNSIAGNDRWKYISHPVSLAQWPCPVCVVFTKREYYWGRPYNRDGDQLI